MIRFSVAAVLLLAASASGHNPLFARSGCGCLRNPVAAELTVKETTQLRGYLQQRGVKHYGALSDSALKAMFHFNLINNFPNVVPATRSGMMQVVSESLSSLTDDVLPSVQQCGQIAGYLKQSVPELIGGRVNIDLKSLVASASVILHQRGVKISMAQLNILLKTGLMAYLKSTAYQSSYSSLIQLISSLDHIDHNLPNILDQESLLVVRRALENRFNLDREIFDKRYKQAVKSFEANRRRILASFNALAYRGPDYEVNMQAVIKAMIVHFPGLASSTARSALNLLQLTNSAGGKATPKDLLAMITVPKLDASLRSISEVYAQRALLKMPDQQRDLTVVQIREAYTLFTMALMSQGIRPVNQLQTFEAFIKYTQWFFLGNHVYSVEAYLLYALRVVIAYIPRGSEFFRSHIFDSTIVVDNILVPKPWKSIYEEGRDSIIQRIRGLQGSSDRIANRLASGTGEKGYVNNIVNLKPTIIAAQVPTYDAFEYQNVLLSSQHMQTVAYELAKRFEGLKEPSFQLPLLRILVRANLITGTGDKAAAAFRRLFQGLPAYSRPSSLRHILTQLSEHRLQLTEDQLKAALDQFYVFSRSFGYIIPKPAIPSIFIYAVRQYLLTLSKIPAQPFDDDYLKFLDSRLPGIIRQVTVIDNQVPIDDYLSQKILSVFRDVRVSVEAGRVIIRFIQSSNLLGKPVQGVSVVARYQKLLRSLFKRYPINTFIFGAKDLASLSAQLQKVGLGVDLKYLRDVNVMTYIGLGLTNRFPKPLTAVRFRQIVYRCISYFLRADKVGNIPSVEFFRVMLQLNKVPSSKLPVPQVPVVQTDYTPAPIYILRGINLPVKQVEKLIVILRTRFVFVTLDNVHSILVHSVLLLRASGQKVVQTNCYHLLSKYFRGLPKSIAIGAFDIEPLVKEIDDQLVDATISGTGIQAAMVELYTHMHYLKLPIPSVEVRDKFLSFVLGAYGKIHVRRQLPFGKPFYEFLSGFLPKLPDYLQPFPLFAAPQLHSMLYSKLKTPIYASDIPLYLRVVRKMQKGGLTLGGLKSTLSKVDLITVLQAGEITRLLDFVKDRKIKVSRGEIIRAFSLCRLTLGLSSVKISRADLISVFERVMLTIVTKYNSLLLVGYVEEIVLRIRNYKPRIIVPNRPKIPMLQCKHNGKYFQC
uniref:Cement protein 130k n=1 Tax=Megabalanus volcano TaxID=266495 RepID=A0A516EL82_MEGVO|nr:cement protein 130k [Megabalanus volcano]